MVQDEDDLEDGSESDSEGDSALEDDSEDEVEAAEEQGCEEVNHHPFVDYDEEDPPMQVRSTYTLIWLSSSWLFVNKQSNMISNLT